MRWVLVFFGSLAAGVLAIVLSLTLLLVSLSIYDRYVLGIHLKWVGRLGPYFDFWTMGDRHSTTHLRPWLQQRFLVPQQAIASLDQRPRSL